MVEKAEATPRYRGSWAPSLPTPAPGSYVGGGVSAKNPREKAQLEKVGKATFLEGFENKPAVQATLPTEAVIERAPTPPAARKPSAPQSLAPSAPPLASASAGAPGHQASMYPRYPHSAVPAPARSPPKPGYPTGNGPVAPPVAHASRPEAAVATPMAQAVAVPLPQAAATVSNYSTYNNVHNTQNNNHVVNNNSNFVHSNYNRMYYHQPPPPPGPDTVNIYVRRYSS